MDTAAQSGNRLYKEAPAATIESPPLAERQPMTQREPQGWSASPIQEEHRTTEAPAHYRKRTHVRERIARRNERSQPTKRQPKGVRGPMVESAAIEQKSNFLEERQPMTPTGPAPGS